MAPCRGHVWFLCIRFGRSLSWDRPKRAHYHTGNGELLAQGLCISPVVLPEGTKDSMVWKVPGADRPELPPTSCVSLGERGHTLNSSSKEEQQHHRYRRGSAPHLRGPEGCWGLVCLPAPGLA